ncbi:hypothetical protein [Pseudoflavitalea rhizosphaerae]|uniref:hypothetical protein n=1 Tax=Pseudoflavitalea rhizosphaerae TaxID=1884793 RepID=UPI000F8ED9E4|nr:hypothetical protein [Pseudoflavitalea rhizosphaerae]
MKLIISILITALLSFVAGLFLPWWTIAPAALVVALCIHQSPFKSWLTGFLALFLLWGGLALGIDTKNQHVLSAKLAEIFSLGGSSFLLILVTALVGGLVAGFAALTGSYIRKRPAGE